MKKILNLIMMMALMLITLTGCINIDYTVRATNNPNNLVFPYYLMEGVGEL